MLTCVYCEDDVDATARRLTEAAVNVGCADREEMPKIEGAVSEDDDAADVKTDCVERADTADSELTGDGVDEDEDESENEGGNEDKGKEDEDEDGCAMVRDPVIMTASSSPPG
jgi:hypothetical protein